MRNTVSRHAPFEKSIPDLLESIHERDYVTVSTAAEDEDLYVAGAELPKALRRSQEAHEGGGRQDGVREGSRVPGSCPRT